MLFSLHEATFTRCVIPPPVDSFAHDLLSLLQRAIPDAFSVACAPPIVKQGGPRRENG